MPITTSKTRQVSTRFPHADYAHLAKKAKKNPGNKKNDVSPEVAALVRADRLRFEATKKFEFHAETDEA